ncbi:MAG: tRNA (adenosine(37)-N6)-threonylcarbamoyltransferase complex dimerization subunit type 1 TsaB, partial [Clostridia bacterium]|nr:tRNA (adenosine(37)-N6)-threonylcarbamoyltransferase complex dimerization subunit type 1 TsaB [Clostridia bacterium]
KIDALIEEIKDQKVCFLGDGAKLCIKAGEESGVSCFVPDENNLYPKASSVGLIGYEKNIKGENVSAENLSPLYLRPPQAERMKTENNERK